MTKPSMHAEVDYEGPERPPVETDVHRSGIFTYFNKVWKIAWLC